MTSEADRAELRDFVARATLNGDDRPRLLAEQVAAERKQRAEELRLLDQLAQVVASLPSREEIEVIADMVANLTPQPCVYCGELTRGRVCRSHADLLAAEYKESTAVPGDSARRPGTADRSEV